jgi:hypothetical protein
MATVAVFIALGGSAYALSNNSVKSRHIDNGQVKTEDLDGDAVTGGKIEADAVKASDVNDEELTGDDVADQSLTGDDLAFGSLTGLAIDEGSLDPEQLPATASFASQIRNVGTGGDVLFGGGSGRTTASTDMAEVQMVGGDSVEIFGIQAWVDTPPGAGESRTFMLVRRGDPDSLIIDTAITCTIGEGEEFCEDRTLVASLNANLFAIKVESVGAGLSSGDDAYVGLNVHG